MAKQKSTVTGVLFTVVVLLVVLVIFSPFIIDSILKTGIETAIKKQLNVDSSVSRVHLNMAAGSIEVNDLKISNPPGYEFERILELKSIGITADLRSLFSDTVEVNQVSLNDITIVIEQKGLTSNLNDILKSMPKKSSAEAEKPAQNAKNVHISSLDIQNIDVKVKLLPIPGKSDAVQLKISALHFSNIGGKKTTLADVVGKVFTEIANAIATQGADVIPGELLGPIQENIGEAGKEILKVGENLQKGLKDANSPLQGLFKKKKKD
jgi:uncharacterized protein involved in outer membrane biogenesis